ncbi:MAG: protease modulator HflK [Bryobacteraceae bacterium]
MTMLLDTGGPIARRRVRLPWVESEIELRLLIGGLIALWLLSGIYLVPADQQAVVTRFGSVVEKRVLPGIHYALPWPIDEVTKLKVQQLQRLIVGGGASDAVLGRTQPLASQFLTGDQNIIHVRVAVQYSVSDPARYLFTSQDVPKTVGAAVESELARRIANHGVDAVLTTEKVAIRRKFAGRRRSWRIPAAGVTLRQRELQSAAPPPEARDAFNDVASARADSARIVNESQGYANDVIPRAARRSKCSKPRLDTNSAKSTRPRATRRDSIRWPASTLARRM